MTPLYAQVSLSKSKHRPRLATDMETLVHVSMMGENEAYRAQHELLL